MPLAIVVFSLPTEQEEYEEILRAPGYRAALGEVWNRLRQKLKYEEISEAELEPYEKVRAWIVDACQEQEIEVP